MCLVLLALYAMLFEFQAILQNFLILGRAIVQGFTDCALQFNEGILGHTRLNKCCQKCTGIRYSCQFMANVSELVLGSGLPSDLSPEVLT